MNYEVFISYRRSDGSAMAYLLHEKLTALGYKVFYDVKSLTSGKFDTKLDEVIDVCKDVVVVLAKTSLDRCDDPDDVFRHEIEYSIQTKKNIVPVFLNEFSISEALLPETMKELLKFNGRTADFSYFDSFIDRVQECFICNDEKHENLSASNKDLKHILLWSDCDLGVMNKLVKKLEMGDGYYIEVIEDPIEILSKEMSCIDTIILLDTDVTKLSNNDKASEKINEALTEYVNEGGRLIGAHDLIYRRTRNKGLQQLAGCEITNFQRCDTVKYLKTDLCEENGLFINLPEEFLLHDGELCWSQQYSSDIDVYFESEEGHPLIFTREVGNGVFIWINPGDYKDFPPASIAKPEKHFLEMLKELIMLKY